MLAQRKRADKARVVEAAMFNHFSFVEVCHIKPNKRRNYDTKRYRKSGACFFIGKP